MASINLSDLANPQYTSMTGRKTRVPYSAALAAMAETARYDAAQKALDEQRKKELEQAASQFDESQALENTKLAAAEEQAKQAAQIQGVQTAILAASVADKAGLINLKDIASGIGPTLQSGGEKIVDLANLAKNKIWPTETVTAAEGASALAPETAAAMESEIAMNAPGYGVEAAAPEAGGASISGAVPVLAIIAGAELARQKWGGDPNTPYADKSTWEKMTAAPGLNAVLGVSPLDSKLYAELFGESNVLTKFSNKLGQAEEDIVGKPLDLAFAGKPGESQRAFEHGVLETIGITPNKTTDTIGDILNPAGYVMRKAGCIIVTCCTGRDSYEVGITREYRDKFLDADALKGYYMLADEMVPKLEADETLRRHTKETLVDPLIEYGEYCLGKRKECRTAAKVVAEDFIRRCRELGATVESYTRSNGEVIR